jgi:hypothetical protein
MQTKIDEFLVEPQYIVCSVLDNIDIRPMSWWIRPTLVDGVYLVGRRLRDGCPIRHTVRKIHTADDLVKYDIFEIFRG